jgi:hypothetical protein
MGRDTYWVAVDREGHFGLFAGDGPARALRCDENLALVSAPQQPAGLPWVLGAGGMAVQGEARFDVYPTEEHEPETAAERMFGVCVLSASSSIVEGRGGIALEVLAGGGAYFPAIPSATLRDLHVQRQCARCWTSSWSDEGGGLPSDNGVYVYRSVGGVYCRLTVPSPASHFGDVGADADARALSRTLFDGSFRSVRRLAVKKGRLAAIEEVAPFACARCEAPRKRARKPTTYLESVDAIFSALDEKRRREILRGAQEENFGRPVPRRARRKG